jgi:hypothetical protein
MRTEIQTPVNGTTAGSFLCSEPVALVGNKKVTCYLTGYQNTTATPQTYTFPTAFANAPGFTQNSDPLSSTSTTALSLPASMSTPTTATIVLEGY